MQDRPTAQELLETIGDLLEGEVLPAVGGALKHQVRVAGNLCRILQREAAQGPQLDRRAAESIAELLGAEPEADLQQLQRDLADRIRNDDDVAFERAAWPVLVEIVRGKLAINKPGHDAYDFSGELDP